MAERNPVAEKWITYMLSQKIPYHIHILNNDFIVNNVNAFPPGNITEMFTEFLIENNLLKNKVIADVAFGCFPLGIIAVKNGANTVIGVDISEYALQCATDNLLLNNIDTKKVHLFKGDGVSPLLSNFAGKVDIIVAGAPWDRISKADFEAIAPERKPMSRAFYDIDDELMTSIMVKGFELL
jgi:release factor glutamine methyltransferase